MIREVRRVALPDGADKSPYFKYIGVPLIVPTDQEVEYYTHLKGNPDEAMSFYDRAKFAYEGENPIKEGCYMLKEGGILIAANVEMPRTTPEMLEWWLVWHSLDPLRYALWNPEDHFDATLPDEDRKRITDPNFPVREKMWNLHSSVLESFNGDKPSHITINFTSPEKVGFDKQRVGSDTFQLFSGGNSSMKVGPFEIKVFACGTMAYNKRGIREFRERWWFGYNVDEATGQVIKEAPKALNLIAPKAAMLLVHCHKEYSHLDKFLPEIYAEQKDNW